MKIIKSIADVVILTPHPTLERLFILEQDWEIRVVSSDEGTLHYKIQKGFTTDARSGGPLVDSIIPWTGNQMEMWSWFVHDVNYYGFVSFSLANEILRQMLLLAGMSSWKTFLVYHAVDLFGESSWTPLDVEPPEPEYKGNREKVTFTWEPK